jgi:hypothetical protein
MKSSARELVKNVLRSAGYEVHHISAGAAERLGSTVPADKYQMVVNELHGGLSELVFPGLPQCPGRRELLAELIGTPVSEAMYIIAHLHQSLRADGDVCEFGVAQGATSALLANEIRPSDKRLWLFDSFQGLPAPTEKDVLINDIFGLGSMERYAGTMASPVEMVKQRLGAIDFPMSRVRIVPGFIEETIKSSALPQKICFAYVDFDFYEPILTTLNWLRPRLAAGGAVIVDDYGFFSSGAKTAVDEFIAGADGELEMTLPLSFAAESTPFCILRRTTTM